jgi:type II secretory pathway pseudopilin PulG
MIETSTPRRHLRGFSTLELLVVIGIMGTVAAIGLPRLITFVKLSQIRGAASSVASELTSARAKAIQKNVNFGAVFVIRSATSYQWVLEDLPGALATRQDINGTTALKGLLQNLPVGVQFDTSCPVPSGETFSAADRGLRFNRFGGWCDPDSSTPECPDLPTTGTLPTAPLLMNGSSGTLICVYQPRTSLRRWVWVSPGGRVQAQP